MPEKVKVKKSLMAYRGVSIALARLKTARMSARLGYSVNSVMKEVRGVLEPFDEAMKDLGRKYNAEFTEGGGAFEVSESEAGAFKVEAEELAAEEREIEVYQIELPPEIEVEGMGEVLEILDDIVVIKGVNENPKPKRPMKPDGTPYSDQEWAQKAVTENEKKE